MALRRKSGRTEPVKMIAIDLDGTLLRSDGTVSPHTIAVLQEARRRGIVIAISTGRMYGTAKPYGDMLGLGDSPMILFSGGLIQTLETKKKLFEQTISPADAQRLLALAREQGWQMQTYIDDVLRVAEDEPLIREYEEKTHCHAVICGDAFYTTLPAGTNKILSRGTHEELLRRKACIEKEMPHMFTLCFSEPTFLEIMPKGVHKGLGIEKLGQAYHIDTANIMAVGDSQNDIDMLKTAGFPVVMANAAEEIKQYGQYITLSHDEDGVAAAVEKFVL